MSELARRLKIVDPNLTIISGRRRRRSHSLNQTDWGNANGVECPRCQRETLRLLNGLCPQCHQKEELQIARKMELKARVRSLLPIFRDRRLAGRKG